MSTEKPKVALVVHYLTEFHKRKRQVVEFEVPEEFEGDRGEYANQVARGFLNAGFHGSSKDQEFWVPAHRVLMVYGREEQEEG